MLSRDQGRRIVDAIVGSTKYHAIVHIGDDGERLTRFAESEIHQNMEIDNTIVTLTLCEGRKSASAQTNALDPAGLKRLVADTEAMLSHAPEGEYEFIPTPPQGKADAGNDTRLAAAFDIKGRAETLKRCIATLGSGFTAAGTLSLGKFMAVYGDSVGNFHYHNYDKVEFEVVVTHKDGDTGYGAVTSNNLDRCDIDAAFKTAYDKAKAAIGPVFADLGAYTVVLEPAAVADLLKFALFDLNGAAYDKGLSFASGRMGERIFGENFTIRDDITNPLTFPRLTDAEGYVRRPLTLVENGVLKNVLYCAKTAKKAGVEPTGHAFGTAGDGGWPLNVVMDGGDGDLEGMIAGVKKGILVTHFWYCNAVNRKTLQITGLTRDGTFMIENGKIAKPLKNMRFTESLLDAFSNIAALSRDTSPVGMFGGVALLPAMVIEDFHFTSGQNG